MMVTSLHNLQLLGLLINSRCSWGRSICGSSLGSAAAGHGHDGDVGSLTAVRVTRLRYLVISAFVLTTPILAAIGGMIFHIARVAVPWCGNASLATSDICGIRKIPGLRVCDARWSATAAVGRWSARARVIASVHRSFDNAGGERALSHLLVEKFLSDLRHALLLLDLHLSRTIEHRGLSSL